MLFDSKRGCDRRLRAVDALLHRIADRRGDLAAAEPDVLQHAVVEHVEFALRTPEGAPADVFRNPQPRAGADGCIQVTGTVVSGNGYSGYIMPPELASGTADYFLNTGSTDVLAFTPTEAMVAEAEAALPVYVAASPRATERIINELATYQRQYLGFTTADGSVLVINAFCDSSYDPAGNVVVVMDGGDCFWQAVYDLTTHAFTYFSVNGNA